MDKQPDAPRTLGQAIDELICTLRLIEAESRITAIRTACEYLKIPLSEATPLSPASSTAIPAGWKAALPGGSIDIKSLRNEKRPSSANEMAAVVAFYLSELVPEGERKLEVQAEDMKKYFKQAGFPLPKQLRMLLPNAKNSGYFDSSGGGYKLNPVGYNLVAHNLPRTAGTGTPLMRKRSKVSAQKPKPKKTK